VSPKAMRVLIFTMHCICENVRKDTGATECACAATLPARTVLSSLRTTRLQAAVLLWALVPRLADRRDLWPILSLFHELFWDRVTAAIQLVPACPLPALVSAALLKLISGTRTAAFAAKTESPRSEMTPLSFYTSASASVSRPQLALLLATLGTACCRGGGCSGHSTLLPLAGLRAALENLDFLGQKLAVLAADECTRGPRRTLCRQQLARALAIRRAHPIPLSFLESSALLDPKMHGQIFPLYPTDPARTAARPPAMAMWPLQPPTNPPDAPTVLQARVGQRFVGAAHVTLGRVGAELRGTSGLFGFELSLCSSTASEASVVMSTRREPPCSALPPLTQLRLAAVPAAVAAVDALARAAVAWGCGMGGPLEPPVGPPPPRPWIVHRQVSFSSADPHRAFAEVARSELTEIDVAIAEKAAVVVVVYGETGDLESSWPQRPAGAWLDDWAPALQLHRF
jgi:hypothetical protein